MSDIFVDLRKMAGSDKATKLMDIIPQMGTVDTLSITMDRIDAHDSQAILDVLAQNGFDYQPKGGEDDYSIVAKRIH